jgi:hypothetical protein
MPSTTQPHSSNVVITLAFKILSFQFLDETSGVRRLLFFRFLRVVNLVEESRRSTIDPFCSELLVCLYLPKDDS